MSTDPNAPVVDQSGNVQVTDAAEPVEGTNVVVPENEKPLDKDGHALVPGTPDEQIVANRLDAPIDYKTDLEAIVADLDKVLHNLGNDLSNAVTSDDKNERVAGVQLRLALDSLQGARDYIAGIDPAGGGIGVKEGV